MDIERIQRSFTSRLLKSQNPDLGYLDRLQSLGRHTLEMSRLMDDLCVVYKIFHSQYLDLSPDKFFKIPTSRQTSNRGHVFKIFQMHSSSKYSKESFSFRIVKIWNCLGNKTVTSRNLEVFIRNLKTVEFTKLEKFLQLKF